MAADSTVTAAVPAAGVGLDLGASLAKLVVAGPAGLETSLQPVANREVVLERIRATPGPVGVTGAGAAQWADVLQERRPILVGEFDAVAAGARLLLEWNGVAAPATYLIGCVGTGTSAVLVSPVGARRVGGSAMGGGTFLGLGRLLCGTEEFAALVRLAQQGNRGAIDLLVRDVYREGTGDLPGGLTAASFARPGAQAAPADLAQALCGLLGENLGFICGALAQVHGAEAVLYCGAGVTENPPLAAILVATTAFAGVPADLVPEGAYCGAVGALVRASCQGGDVA